MYLVQLKLFFIHTAEIWSITRWDKEWDGSLCNSCVVCTFPYLHVCYAMTTRRFQKSQKATRVHAQWFTSHSTKNTTKYTHQHYFTTADNSSGQTCPAKKAHTYNGIYHYQHTHQLLEHSVVHANITQLVDHTVHVTYMHTANIELFFNKDLFIPLMCYTVTTLPWPQHSPKWLWWWYLYTSVYMALHLMSQSLC